METSSELFADSSVHFALNNSSAESSPVSTSFREKKFENPSTVPLIKVIHPDTVHFNWNGTEYVGSINVENINDKNVLYKIKTTSPDRFRVRPTSGLLQPGVTAKITVVLQSGYQIQSIFIDKFLIMAMITEKEEATPSEIAEIWKNSENTQVEQNRLKCSIIEPLQATMPSSGNVPHFMLPDDLIDKVEQLKNIMYDMCDYNKKVHKDISYRQNVITVILILLVFCVIFLLFFIFKIPSSSFPKTISHPSCTASRNNDIV